MKCRMVCSRIQLAGSFWPPLHRTDPIAQSALSLHPLSLRLICLERFENESLTASIFMLWKACIYQDQHCQHACSVPKEGLCA